MAKWHADLPDVIDPPDNVCFLVEIPNHPDYIAAFHGTYERLSHWWAWQRDPAKQGRLAAARWRQAVEATWQNIQEIGDMCPLTINVTCGGGASVCCGQQLVFLVDGDLHISQGTIDDIWDLPGGQIDDGLNPPSTDWQNYTEYQNYKCGVAGQYATDLHQTLSNWGYWFDSMAGMSETVIRTLITANTVSSLVTGIISGNFSLGGAVEQLIGVLGNLADWGSSGFTFLSGIMDHLTVDDLQCAIYNAGSATEARDDLVTTWIDAREASGFTSDTSSTLLTEAYDAFFRLFVRPGTLEAAFDYTQGTSQYTGFDCSACTGVVPPVERGTWYLEYGTIPDTNEPLEFQSEEVNGCHRVRILFNHDGANYLSGFGAIITAYTVISGFADYAHRCSPTYPVYRLFQNGTQINHNSIDELITGAYEISGIEIRQATAYPFTLNLSWDPVTS